MQTTSARSQRIGARRSGVVILEVIIILPLLLFEFLAVFEFGFLAIIMNAAEEVVVDGAHEGSLLFPTTLVLDKDGVLDPTDNDDIADAVALHMNRSLAVVGIEIMPTGSTNDNPNRVNAYIRIFRGGGSPAQRGDTTISGHAIQKGVTPTSSECVVTLCFPLVSTAPSGHPVPNGLSMFGFSLHNKYFSATSRFLIQ